MLRLAYYEIPVAHSMVGLAHRIAEQDLDPIQEYLCYWSAFNNIYTVVAERAGRYPQIHRNPDGSPRYTSRGSFQMVSVDRVKEGDRLNAAFDEFSDDLKHDLITHPNTEFFVNRKPVWRETTIELDRLGQRVNGIINMDYTTHPGYPFGVG